MRILHINSYYIDNHLYSYLYRELDSSHKQTIYVPIKWNRSPENQVDLAQGELHFSRILKKKHKFLFKVKVRSLFKDLIGRNLHENCELVHAHNLFNDGALAYELFKSYSLPFTVAVRSTDINLQYKYMVHRRGYIHMVLNSARDIIFISEVSRKKFLDMLPEGLSKSLEKKTMVIPNGIDHFWHKNTAEKAIKDIDSQEPFRFIYVGQILKRKKLELALQALKELNKEGNQFELIVIGGSNNSELEYYSEITAEFENRKDIQYLGKIKDKKKLLEEYRKADAFLMVSRNELFGLVYVEALTQGLPLIFHRSAGIYSFFKGRHLGIALEDYSIMELKNAILEIRKGYNNFTIETKDFESFNWKNIAEIYQKLYASILA